MTRGDSPPPEPRGLAVELAHLRVQPQPHKRMNHEMKAMLQNQTLATNNFQHKQHMAGGEAQAFMMM